jgi:aspartate aminotransferase
VAEIGVPRLARRLGGLSESPTLAVSRAAAALRKRGAEIIDLGLGEPDFPTPDFIKAAAVSALEREKTKYTDVAGVAALREAIVEKYRRRGAATLEVGNVLVSAGGKQALFDACLALFQSGDEVAIFTPYWVSFPEMVRLAEATPVFVPTRRDRGYRPELEALEERATDRLRGVILNTPANPTGAAVSAEELDRILRWCRDRGVVLLFDECYERFLYGSVRHESPAERWAEHGHHVVISGSASKTFAMTGWRLGWAVGPAGVIQAMVSLQSHSTSNASSLSQEAVLAALTDAARAEAAVSAMLGEYERRRSAICAGLNAIDGVSCPLPDGAFYAFADVSALYGPAGAAGSAEFAAILLERAGVATVPGAAFGEDACVRFSYAAPLEAIQEGMRRFQEFAANLAVRKPLPEP